MPGPNDGTEMRVVGRIPGRSLGSLLLPCTPRSMSLRGRGQGHGITHYRASVWVPCAGPCAAGTITVLSRLTLTSSKRQSCTGLASSGEPLERRDFPSFCQRERGSCTGTAAWSHQEGKGPLGQEEHVPPTARVGLLIRITASWGA